MALSSNTILSRYTYQTRFNPFDILFSGIKSICFWTIVLISLVLSLTMKAALFSLRKLPSLTIKLVVFTVLLALSLLGLVVAMSYAALLVISFNMQVPHI